MASLSGACGCSVPIDGIGAPAGAVATGRRVVGGGVLLVEVTRLETLSERGSCVERGVGVLLVVCDLDVDVGRFDVVGGWGVGDELVDEVLDEVRPGRVSGTPWVSVTIWRAGCHLPRRTPPAGAPSGTVWSRLLLSPSRLDRRGIMLDQATGADVRVDFL